MENEPLLSELRNAASEDAALDGETSPENVLVAGLKKSALQTVELARKNALVAWRNPLTTLGRLLFPAFCLLMLFALTHVSFMAASSDDDLAVVYVNVPRCVRNGGANEHGEGVACHASLVYSPTASPVARFVAEHVAAHNEPPLRMDVDVLGFASYDDAIDFIQVNATSPAALGGLIFDCVTRPPVDYPTFAPTLEPTIYPTPSPVTGVPPVPTYPPQPTPPPPNNCQDSAYQTIGNSTSVTILWTTDLTDSWVSGETAARWNYAAALKLAADRALFAHAGYGDVKLDVETRWMDEAPIFAEALGWSSRAELITAILLCPTLLIGFWAFYISANSLVSYERTEQFRDSLRAIGVQNGPYWLSFALTESLLAIVAALLTCAAAYAMGITVFVDAMHIMMPSVVLLALNCTASGLVLASVAHKAGFSMIFMTLTFLFALAVMATANAFGGMAIGIIAWWNVGMNWWSTFGFAQNFVAIVGTAQSRIIEHALKRNKSALVVNWSSMDFVQHATLEKHLFLLVVDYFVSVFFAYYLDSCFPGQSGVPLPLSYLFNPSYWGLMRTEVSIDLDSYNESNLNTVLTDLDPDVRAENDQVVETCAREVESEEANVDHSPLLVLKLSKTYRGSRIRSGGDCRALDMLSLGAAHGEVLCLLGHNGSGKTTTVKLLCGLTAPTFGDALVYGQSITQSIDRVRAMIGIMHQKNILWDHLTVQEHIKLYARLRGVAQVEDEVRARLGDVDLYDLRDRKAHQLSGGQSRRLCYAISVIGDPRVLILDEPTASLDPKARRSVWNAIAERKKRALVVLLTHSLVEADAIGDKLAVLALGRLRAVGRSLHLKKRFGIGYNVSVACATDDDAEARVKARIGELVPNATLETSTAGALTYALPYEAVAELRALLGYLEEASAGSSPAVREFSVSNTTLEEVFLRVTHGGRSAAGAAGAAGARQEGLLNVVSETDDDEVLASVMVKASTTLGELRRQIDETLLKMTTTDDASGAADAADSRRDAAVGALRAGFIFVSQGAGVRAHLESSLYALDFAPTIVMRPLAGASSSSSSLPVSAADGVDGVPARGDVDDRVVLLEQQLARTEKQLAVARRRIRELEAQIDELKQRV